MSYTQGLDFAAVFVFALTGGLVASRAQLDLVGFLFIASLTAVGGGTLRDLLLRRDDIFWVANPTYIAVACIAAILVFFTAHRIESRYRAILWLDALALSVAVTAGVFAARLAGVSEPVVVIMGVATGSFGGMMRDVVCNEVPMVLRQGELYITAAAAGATATVLAAPLTDSVPVLIAVCAGSTFALRAGSLAFGWRLPVYKPRLPKTNPPRR